MKVYDPVQRRFFQAVDTVQAPAVEGYIPTRGRGPDDPWFVHRLWTNETLRIEDLPEHVQVGVRIEVDRLDLCERLLQRCDDVRGLALAPVLGDVQGEQALAEAIQARAGDGPGLMQAVSTARSRGFTASDVAHALSRLDSVATLGEVLDGVEVVSVGQLTEKMRLRPDRS